MEKITKQEFETAIELIKNYKIQEKVNVQKSKTVVENVLNESSENILKIIDYIFIEKENLRYNEVVVRMHFFLNNKLLFKIGIRNTKIIFQEFLKSDLIKSKVEIFKSFNTYYK